MCQEIGEIALIGRVEHQLRRAPTRNQVSAAIGWLAVMRPRNSGMSGASVGIRSGNWDIARASRGESGKNEAPGHPGIVAITLQQGARPAKSCGRACCIGRDSRVCRHALGAPMMFLAGSDLLVLVFVALVIVTIALGVRTVPAGLQLHR